MSKKIKKYIFLLVALANLVLTSIDNNHSLGLLSAIIFFALSILYFFSKTNN